MDKIKSLAEYYEAKQKAVLLSDALKGSAENKEFWRIIRQMNLFAMDTFPETSMPAMDYWIAKQDGSREVKSFNFLGDPCDPQ
jgi:hypothetical protein